METKGIDISYFQGNINWPQVEDNKIEFAMIRATYGTTGVDRKFIDNIKNIQKTKIYPGAYHYCYALNPAEAIAEAKHFIDVINPYKLYYPAALDMEEKSIAELGKNAATDIITAFVDTLKAEKYYPVLYTNLDWIQNYIDMKRISDLDIWLSEWSSELTHKQNVTIWQYSTNGSIPGIPQNVDMNISYKDYPLIIKEHGLNGTNIKDSNPHTPYIDPESNTSYNPQKTIPILYKVVAGDSLWSIAKKILGDGSKFTEIMRINNLNGETIYPGQVIKIPQNNINTIIMYRVRRGNTLWSIAERFLGDGKRYREIMEMNKLSNDNIYPGQILRIPSNNL